MDKTTLKRCVGRYVIAHDYNSWHIECMNCARRYDRTEGEWIAPAIDATSDMCANKIEIVKLQIEENK